MWAEHHEHHVGFRPKTLRGRSRTRGALVVCDDLFLREVRGSAVQNMLHSYPLCGSPTQASFLGGDTLNNPKPYSDQELTETGNWRYVIQARLFRVKDRPGTGGQDRQNRLQSTTSSRAVEVDTVDTGTSYGGVWGLQVLRDRSACLDHLG